MKNFIVIGSSVAQSCSPKLFNYIFKKLNINANYNFHTILNNDDLDLFCNSSLFKNLNGMNITMPFKSSIFKYCDFSNNCCVNCIDFINNKAHGHNTDIYGFSKLIEYNQLELTKSNILIIGSGGSSYSIIQSLINNNVDEILILSRNSKSSQKLINQFKLSDVSIKIVDTISNYDFIINCTPIGVSNNTNTALLKSLGKSKYFIDINYINQNLSKSIFSKYSDYYISGIDMFIFQALATLDIWFKDKLSEKLDYNELVDVVKNEKN